MIPRGVSRLAARKALRSQSTPTPTWKPCIASSTRSLTTPPNDAPKSEDGKKDKKKGKKKEQEEEEELKRGLELENAELRRKADALQQVLKAAESRRDAAALFANFSLSGGEVKIEQVSAAEASNDGSSKKGGGIVRNPPGSGGMSGTGKPVRGSKEYVRHGQAQRLVTPIPLREFVTSDPPMLNLPSPETRIETMDLAAVQDTPWMQQLLKSNPSDAGQQLQDYDVHPSTASQLLTKFGNLLDMEAGKLGQFAERVPSLREHVVLLTCPVKGSDPYVDQVMRLTSAALGARIIFVDNKDLFQVKTGYEVITSPPIAAESENGAGGGGPGGQGGSNMGGGGIPGMQRGAGRRPFRGVPMAVVQMGNGIPTMMTEEEPIRGEDLPNVPYPWGTQYVTPKGERQVLPRHRTIPPDPLNEPMQLIQESLTKFFAWVGQKTRGEPVIIYYVDLLRLLTHDESKVSEMVQMVTACVNTARDNGANIVLTGPHTPTFERRSPGTARQGGLSSLLRSLQMGGRDDAAEHEQEEDGEEGGPGGGGGGGGGPDGPDGGGHPMAHLLGGGNRRKVGISFDIPLDTYLGISSVSVFPPRPDFDQTCQNQLPYIYSVENVYKLAFLLPRTSVVGNLDIHTLTSLARSGAAYHNAIAVAAGRLLSERPLSQVEVENVVATYIRLVRERGIDPETGFIQTLQTESDRKELDAFVAQYGVEAAFSPDSNPVVLPLVTSLLIQALAETSAERTALAQTKHGLAHAGLFGNPADRSRLSQREEKLLTQCLVRPDPSLTSFSQIGGLVRTKRTIGELIRLPLLHPELFDRGILSKSTTGILMFGPPGTGKTLLARAVAAESGANFLNVQMSDIQSMWVGENEKNVKALFSLARKLTPCVIFIDEIDALLRARQRGQANHVTNTINEFMQEWDGLQSAANKPGSQGGVIVVGATNRPFDLDEAVLRRLPRRILIDLPDRAARAEILRIHLKDDVVGDGTEADRERVVNEVAGLTDGWSGSDLRNICIAAAYASLRTHLGPITTSPFSSSSSTTSTNSKPLSRPPISLSDFTTSLEAGDVRPSLSDRAELTRQLKDWDKQYGTGSGYGLGTSSGGAWGFELEQQQQHKTHKGRRHVVGS